MKNIWKRILRGIDAWIEKQLDKQESTHPRGHNWHPPHTIIHDVAVAEKGSDDQGVPPERTRPTDETHEKTKAKQPSIGRDLNYDGIIDMKERFSTTTRNLRKKVAPTVAATKHWVAHQRNDLRRMSKKDRLKRVLLWVFGGGFIFLLLVMGVLLLYVAGLKIPTFDDFVDREIGSSTKIYDRTGEILLYDVHQGVSRTVINLEDMSPYIIDAIISIEDDRFYEHRGIDFKATVRAIGNTTLTKIGLRKGNTQGGSTLTQQVLKNTLLTSERTFKRKMKEWFLALRLEKILTKDEILANYLNEAPYGGSIYGVETASQSFFGKPASEVTIAEAAYLAAIPNAPTFFSPYGNNVDRLENRKNIVLRLMRGFGYITPEQHDEARAEQVEFRPREDGYAKAIHFVEYVRSELEKTYGEDMVQNGGLRVITTLDYELQEAAEEIINRNALINEEQWNASNAALVAIDPETGGILAMVGSRGYSDPDVDGKFNVALAQRQPGSSFKPFAYATGLAMGYTEKTILFDTQTQFNPSCTLDQGSMGVCYRPGNYDGLFKGPLTMRDALAQSRNIPAVKMLYLVGVKNTIETAKAMGITGLRDANFYGLTLVLGGGEVRLLDITSAYGVFANDGIRNQHHPIFEVYDSKGELLEKHTPRPEQVIDPEVARIISDILADNEARAPLFGLNSSLNFGGNYDVAAKTGTTNDSRDGWLVGYSPSIVTGVWSGNNDNSPMSKGSTVSAPAWQEFMSFALARRPNKRFIPPATPPDDLKPVLRGVWEGNDIIVLDRISGKLATDLTPPETREELVIPEVHNILHWVDPRDPRGPAPNPISDPQYPNWEASVQAWLTQNPLSQSSSTPEQITALLLQLQQTSGEIPYDDVHTIENKPIIQNITTTPSSPTSTDEITIITETETAYPLQTIEYFLDDIYIGSSEFAPFTFSFIPNETEAYITGRDTYTLRVEVVDNVFNRSEEIIPILIEDQ